MQTSLRFILMDLNWPDVFKEIALEGPWGCTFTELWPLIHMGQAGTQVKELIFRQILHSKSEVELIYIVDRCVKATTSHESNHSPSELPFSMQAPSPLQ